MYGNYGYNPYYNPQSNLDRINNQIKELESMKTQYQNMQPQQVPTNLTQNFQLAPNNTGIKYVNNIEEVKKELVFTDTLFPNKEYTLLFVKNAKGEIKTFELKGIIEKDEKDRKIDELMAKIDMLEKEKIKNESSTNDIKYDDGKPTKQKSTGLSKDK